MPDIPRVIAVASDSKHRFSKQLQPSIELIAAQGVIGDAHCGVKVQHRSRVKADPNRPNLRQVHLISNETLLQLRGKGYELEPACLGENITTESIDLLSLPQATQLRIGDQVVLELTGLRNPCQQLNDFKPGLMQALIEQDDAGRLLLKAGVMAVVLEGGEIRPNDIIRVVLPVLPHLPLQRV